MTREKLLTMLERYRPIDDADRRQAASVASFVRDEPRCFERTLAVGHLTGSAWVVDPSRTRVLLTHHRKLNRWLQLGGHADGEPDLLSVALREAREESGIAELAPLSDEIFDVDVHRIPARGAEAEHSHFDVRFALQAARTDVVVSEESHDLRWVPLEEIEQIAPAPEMRRMAEKWRRSSWAAARDGR